VCEEVCGSGYGGLGCGAQCDTYTTTKFNSPAIIALHEMCPILCENKLGGSNCNCAEDVELDKATVERNRDLLCSDSCRFRYYHLSGCTACTFERKDALHVIDSSSEEHREYSLSSEAERSPEDLTTENDSITDEESTTEEDTTTEGDTTTEDTTTEITTTTSTTTTTTHPPTTTTKSTTQAPTTPDWPTLCEALCRNGEGGSLCNCDIPPFF